MKGLVKYFIILVVTAFISIASFYLLSQLLSKEEEVSTISRKISSIVNKIEYSNFYFTRMIESEFFELKKKFPLDEVASRLVRKYEIEIDGVFSIFEVVKSDVNGGTVELEVSQTSIYSDKLFKVNAKKSFRLNLMA